MKQKKYLRILKGIKIFIISLIIFVLLFTVLAINVNKNNTDGIFGHKLFIVVSDSMKPKFSAGDIVITKKVETTSLKNGDVITFLIRDGSVVTHKIEDIEECEAGICFVTKGINSKSIDEERVVPQNVIGKYSLSIPKMGYLLNFLKTPLGYILLILLPFLFIILSYGFKFINLYKQYKVSKRTKVDQEVEDERNRNQLLQEELKLLKKQLEGGNNG